MCALECRNRGKTTISGQSWLGSEVALFGFEGLGCSGLHARVYFLGSGPTGLSKGFALLGVKVERTVVISLWHIGTQEIAGPPQPLLLLWIRVWSVRMRFLPGLAFVSWCFKVCPVYIEAWLCKREPQSQNQSNAGRTWAFVRTSPHRKNAG